MRKFDFMNFNLLFNRIRYFISTYRITLLFALLIIISAILLPRVFKNIRTKGAIQKPSVITDCNRALYATAPINSTRKLNDINDVQLVHAQLNGLKNIYISNASFEADSAMLVKKNILVHLKNNSFYKVKDMTHSYPFTTPEMADLLNTISVIFHQKLKEKHQDHFCYIISSALRTNEMQQSLSLYNRNASTQSAHLYGATLDITYKDFYDTQLDTIVQNRYAADALKETMIDLREQCRLLAVRERHQACYHFTVVNCDPLVIPSEELTKKVFKH